MFVCVYLTQGDHSPFTQTFKHSHTGNTVTDMVTEEPGITSGNLCGDTGNRITVTEPEPFTTRAHKESRSESGNPPKKDQPR